MSIAKLDFAIFVYKACALKTGSWLILTFREAKQRKRG
jgi:hypothetical protein